MRSSNFSFYVKFLNCYSLASEKYICGLDTVFDFVNLPPLCCWVKKVWSITCFSPGASTTRELRKVMIEIRNVEMERKYGVPGISQRENFIKIKEKIKKIKEKNRVKNSCSVLNKIISTYKVSIKMFQAKVQVSFTNSI